MTDLTDLIASRNVGRIVECKVNVHDLDKTRDDIMIDSSVFVKEIKEFFSSFENVELEKLYSYFRMVLEVTGGIVAKVLLVRMLQVFKQSL